MRLKVLCISGILLGAVPWAGLAAAQEATKEQQLEEVIVTGTRESTPVTPIVTRYGTQYNLVTEEQIKEQGGTDFQSALRNVPGVMFQSKNLMGSQTSHSMYVRGRGASHPSADFAIQFDGAPHYGALFGQVLGDGIALSTIGGIQVFKSPQPAQFGSGYASINILPKYLTEEGQEIVLNSSGGSYSTFDQSLSGGLKKGPYDFYVSQSWASTDGHVDHSRAQQQSYYVNLGHQITKEWNVRLLSNYVNSQTLNPVPYAGVTWSGAERYDTETTFTTLTLNHQTEAFAGYLKAYWNETNFDLLQELTNGVRYANGSGGLWSRQEATLYGVRGKETLHLWSGGEILVGTDLDMTELKNTQRTYDGQAHAGVNGGLAARVWDFPETTLVSPYLAASQTVGRSDDWHITPSAGFRYFAHNEFKDAPSYQAGLVAGYGHTDLNFNYARGVNYPSPIVAMNMVLVSTAVVNPRQYWETLKPEIVDHYEVGLTHTWPRLASIGVTGFYDRGKDRYMAYMSGTIPTLYNDPIGHYEIRGLELTGTLTPIKGLELFVSTTLLDAEATGKDGVKYDKMPYTPAAALQGGVTWNFLEHFRLYADVQYLHDVYAGTNMRNATFNYTQLTDTSKLGDITLFNARLSYRFTYAPWRVSDSEVFFAVNNIFDQEYEYAKGYTMPGRTFFGGLSLKFK